MLIKDPAKRPSMRKILEKDFLSNDQCFLKNYGNVKNRVNTHATTSDKNAIKYFSKVDMKNAKYFSGLYLIEMYKQEIVYALLI
jgi:hypothetical protein